jgi:hypothetical protein
MRVSVPDAPVSVLGKFFSTVDFSGGEGVSMGFERLDRLSLPRRAQRRAERQAERQLPARRQDEGND